MPPSGRATAVRLAFSRTPGHAVRGGPRVHPARPRDAGALAIAKASAALTPLRAPAPGAASGPAPQAAVLPGLDQPGLAASDNTTANQGTPSDSTGAIGPSAYVEFVNSKVGVFDRGTLARLSTADLDAFVGHAGDNVFDPQIEWDQQWGRWIYLADDVGTLTNALDFGWSKTSDPSDLVNGWCRYAASTATLFDDFPKLGHDDARIVFGVNQFLSSTSSTFLTAQIWSLPKPADPASCPAAPTATMFGSQAQPLAAGDGSPAFTPVPANTTDSSPRTYVLAADDASGGAVHSLTAWHVDGGGLTLDGPLAVGAYGVPPAVPQPGTGFAIDSSDARLDQVVARADPGAGGAEALWAQHAIAGSGRSVVRWYEVLPATLALAQQGTASDPSLYLFNAAISPDAGGRSAALFYNTGNGSHLVDWRVQVHRGSDAPSVLGAPIVLASSTAADGDFSCSNKVPCRWGDYPGATPDPAAAATVWGTGMLDGPPPTSPSFAQWTTQNAAVQLTQPPTAAFTVAPATASRVAPVSVDGSASSDADGAIASYAWDFGDGSSGAGVSASHTYHALGTFTVTLRVTDADGNVSAVSHPVTVQNLPPTATLGASPSSAAPREAVAFSSAGSQDADGGIASIAWSFGDGASAAGATAAHAFRRAGRYTVTLTVTDGDGASTAATRTLLVAKAGVRLALRARLARGGRVRLSGGLLLAHGFAGACAGARVTLRLSAGRRSSVRHLPTRAGCRFTATPRIPRALQGVGPLRVRESFAGSASLAAAKSITRMAR